VDVRSLKLRAVGVIAVAALLGAGAIGASAKSDSAKSKVKITEGSPTLFKGKVTSKESRCEKGRKVSLYYSYSGPYKRGDVLGTVKTDADGSWLMKGTFSAGVYYARVKEKKVGSVTCGDDDSPEDQY
jgi:hypothetical protein